MKCVLCDNGDDTRIVGSVDSATLPARLLHGCPEHAPALRDYLGLTAAQGDQSDANPRGREGVLITRTLWDVVCVTVVDGRECEAEAAALPTEELALDWRERHWRDTGHHKFLRVQSDYEELAAVPAPERPAVWGEPGLRVERDLDA